MTFGQPENLVLLLVVVGMSLAALWLIRWRRRAAHSFAGPQASRWPRGGTLLATALLIVAATLLALAAARPQWGSHEITSQRAGVDLVFVLDISLSMTATDTSPNRLARAQAEITRLIEAERGNRFGLVLFAGTAILRSPLTTDAQALSELILRADREGGLIRVGSDIGAALQQAGLILAASENPGRAVIVVSDGEDHVGTFARRAALLQEDGIIVLTAGVGTPQGSTLVENDPEHGSGVKLDSRGEPVITRLDEQNLGEIALAGGGRYLRLDTNTSLLSFRDDLNRLEQVSLGIDTRQIRIERFQLFVAVAAGLLVFGWFATVRLKLPFQPPRRADPQSGLALLLLAVVMVACSQDSLNSKIEEANELFDSGAFQAALETYQDLLAQRPDVRELSYNTGNTLHRLGNYERAIVDTRRALPPTDVRLGAITYYALGNHYLALENLELAFDAFRNALLLDPNDLDAKHNLELTLLLIQEEEDQQGQPDNPDAQDSADDPQAEDQQPGDGDGDTDSAQDGDQPAPGGEGDSDSQQPQPGDAADSTPQSPAEVARQLEEALRGIDQDLTFEEALRILDLLQEQQQSQTLPGPRGGQQASDY